MLINDSLLSVIKPLLSFSGKMTKRTFATVKNVRKMLPKVILRGKIFYD